MITIRMIPIFYGEIMENPKKHSHKRDAIYNAIRSTKTHPSAEWIYKKLKPEYPDLSLGTVYRNISRFKDDGSIITVGVVNGQERYDGNTVPHTHFICDVCGRVIDIDGASDPVADTSALIENGFDIRRFELTFYGKCPLCKFKAY